MGSPFVPNDTLVLFARIHVKRNGEAASDSPQHFQRAACWRAMSTCLSGECTDPKTQECTEATKKANVGLHNKADRCLKARAPVVHGVSRRLEQTGHARLSRSSRFSFQAHAHGHLAVLGACRWYRLRVEAGYVIAAYLMRHGRGLVRRRARWRDVRRSPSRPPHALGTPPRMTGTNILKVALRITSVDRDQQQ